MPKIGRRCPVVGRRWLWELAVVLILTAAESLAGDIAPAGRSILTAGLVWQTLGAVRDAERPLATRYVDGKAAASQESPQGGAMFEASATSAGARFYLRGEVTQRRSMRWKASLPKTQVGARSQYFQVRFRAEGVSRTHDVYPVVEIAGRDDGGKPGTANLINCHGVINDGRWHVLMGKLTSSLTPDEVRVQITTENSQARLEIESLELYADRESLSSAAVCRSQTLRADQAARFVTIPLDDASDSAALNDNIATAFDRLLDKQGTIVDGGRGWPAGRAVVDEVPFLIADGTTNMMRPAEHAEVNNEKVDFLGEKVYRAHFFRRSRDDCVTVSLGGRKASEVMFLLVCEMPAIQTRYGLTSSPYRLDDVETFAVELAYADGTRDWAFPYSLADGGCVLARMLGAYVVPADPSKALERIVFHNRLFHVTMSVAALTLNTSTSRMVPALVEETPPVEPPALADPPILAPWLTFRGGLLQGGNGYYSFTVDCREGFSFRNFVSRWSPRTSWSLKPSSGLQVALNRREQAIEEANGLASKPAQATQVVVGKTIFTGLAFTVENVKVDRSEATIALRSAHAELPLALVVSLVVDASPRLGMKLEATNLGKTPLDATITFPAIQDLAIGEPGNTWIFFPQYRTNVSRDPGFFVAGSGPSYSHQFFDAFNPVAGVGLMALTHNLDQLPLEYSMGKSDAGVCCGVAYPGQFHTMSPGQTFRTPRTSLVWHAGDWHQAAAVYRDWVRTWYRPRRVQGDWWRRAFVFRSYSISTFQAKQIEQTPSILDLATGRYRIDEALEADRRYFGQQPDMVHFYGWYFRDRENNEAWGEYSTPEAYAQAGGLDTLRRAVTHYQNDLHMPLSLYTIGDRCSRGTAAFERFGEEAAEWRYGQPIPLIDIPTEKYRAMCLGYRPWQEHHVADIAKLRGDTGAKILYLDVFPLQMGNVCDCPRHGHPTPLWSDRTSREVLSRIRDAVSQETAIYSEYPASDVTSQDIDGNVAYYNLPLHRHFDKLYDVPSLDERAALESEAPFTLYRYVFPSIKQFCFGVGMEDSRSDSLLKIPFFHGDGELGVTWRLQPERIRQMTNRGLAIQKRYVECFTSDKPEPMIRTERRGVHANRFPGPDCTLWTLYNARYHTVRGGVLAVEHLPGVTYVDAWNDRPLSPTIRDGKAVISLEMEPQGLGCVIQKRTPAADKSR